MTKNRPLSYTLIQTRESGIPRTHARVNCSRCRAHLEVNILSGDNHLTLVERHARNAGWLFNKNVASKCVCPSCYLGDHAEPEKDAPPSQPIPETALAAAFVAAVNKETQVMPQSIPPRLGSSLPSGPKPIGAPTPQQKMKMREQLDGFYDENLKGYLDGHTDKTIADLCGVPWAWVRDLRDVAYGPLEVDAELQEIREQHRQLGEMRDGFSRTLTRLEERIARLEQKRRL